MRIKVSADSTCDLPKEIIERYNISIIPLYIIKDGQAYRDGLEITPDEIFKYVDSGAGICSTSAVNIPDYRDCFSEYLKEYDAVIHVNISSKMSTCHQNALAAAEEFKNVYVVDSRNLSTGSGHLAIDAAQMAEAGMAPQDIFDRLNENARKLEVSFIIDTLKYLYKGGRCSALAALGANVLKLKPCIEVSDGAMGVGKKYRGNFDKVIIQYVHDRLAGRTDIDPRRIFITNTTGVSKDIIKAVRDEINACQKFDEICESYAGCTISNHCGTVCLGILFFTK